jgi:hypothetical protein
LRLNWIFSDCQPRRIIPETRKGGLKELLSDFNYFITNSHFQRSIRFGTFM